MPNQTTYLGETRLKTPETPVSGEYVEIDGEQYYKIAAYDKIRPFFISLVSASDHWLFVSSTGGLSAGRKNEDSPLFPYYTDDRIAAESETTGSKTIIRVIQEDRELLWEPFSVRSRHVYQSQNNLYKNFAGTRILFEEVNEDLGLVFRYSWQFSEKYGIVKMSSLKNIGSSEASVEIVDGLQNLVPYGISTAFQNVRSNLGNAYRKNELDTPSGLGIFVLSSMIVDKAEPSEALKATSVWTTGLEPENVLLSSRQLDAFRVGEPLETEVDVRAEIGAYFIKAGQTLKPQQTTSWLFVGEVNQDHAAIVSLRERLKDPANLGKQLLEDVGKGTAALLEMVGKADGLQLTGDRLSVGRHYANVLFNIMRGGFFDDQYLVEKPDLLDYVQTMNRALATHSFFKGLGDTMQYSDLVAQAKTTKDPDIIRLCYEYLPLTFSRRHGDPSRPWNRFSITVKDEEGNKIRNYEGNWRDIFQNWEALSLSFPEYVISMIAKFVNASTLDGYNPYRITREGIDWEVIEPDDPWSYIGYWGDHQIIYLLKLMEVAQAHHGDQLVALLAEKTFVYANVPYRIRAYADIVRDPQDTIDFDHELEKVIEARVEQRGADGKFVFSADGNLLRASLAEKLLVTLLAKLSNFVPEGGIWLNTQRPEWNDANNALVGNGVSMVTLYYLRRYVAFCESLFGAHPDQSYEVHEPVARMFRDIAHVFQANQSVLERPISDEARKTVVDQLGKIGEGYREAAYQGFDPSTVTIKGRELLDFFASLLPPLDQTIAVNKRSDGLYHAYNLLQFDGEKANVDHLYEMLEGQVAVLSAGVLSLEESHSLLDALKESKIYREDQYSYMLYPDRDLPRFLNKNNIPQSFVDQSKLAKALIADGNERLLKRDQAGDCHFNGAFNNAEDLKATLEDLRGAGYGELVDREYQSYLEVFEEMFNHRAFTGRSGTFFGFEGLGSIYWHMVSKLLLAAQENMYWHVDGARGSAVMGKMVDHYYEIRAGIGMNKSPDLYGSFPTDPYSHTPGNKGAQQPGMTGQVKEDIINRWAELGVTVRDGQISFDPLFLSDQEFLEEEGVFKYFDLQGNLKEMTIQSGQLVFTYCQVPVIYNVSEEASHEVVLKDGSARKVMSRQLSKEDSRALFSRSGAIDSVIVNVSRS